MIWFALTIVLAWVWLGSVVRAGSSPSQLEPASPPAREVGQKRREGEVYVKSDAVVRSAEFRRIEALPRRQLSDIDLTDEFRLPGGNMRLRLVQSQALHEIRQTGGLLGLMSVGAGKALITLLAGAAMGIDDVVLLVPANLRGQTNLHVIPEMSKHWRLPKNLRVVSYTELSLEKNAALLQDLRPGLIVADEAHKLKSRNSGRTRRLIRYFQQFPETKFVALSGTMTKNSLHDYSHLSEIALRAGSPVPYEWQDLRSWAAALDANVPYPERVHPGALSRFCAAGEEPRDGYRRRLTETPGVVSTKRAEVEAGLEIHKHSIDLPQDIRDALTELDEVWVTPGGEELMDVFAHWRAASQLLCGFYTRWNPQPPQWWLDVRSNYTAFIRHKIRYSGGRFDTELQARSAYRNAPEVVAWAQAKEQFEPNVEEVWVSEAMVERMEDWALETGGLVWVSHRPVGRLLKKRGRVPYFGAGDDKVLSHSGPCAASLRAHGTGKNLQYQWSKMLFPSPPNSALDWEQAIGRMHRSGQPEDTVEAHVWIAGSALYDSMEHAMAEAEYLQGTTGQDQKLNIATVVEMDAEKR